MDDEQKKRIGKNIQYIRKYNGKSVADFAWDIGVSESTLTKVECGMKTLSDDVLQRICKISGIPVNGLMYGDLSYLKKNEAKADKKISMVDFFDYMNLKNYQTITLSMFPILNDDNNLDNFRCGIDLAKSLIAGLQFDEDKILKAIDYFKKAYSEGIEIAAINILSLYGCLSFCIQEDKDTKQLEVEIENTKIQSLWDYISFSNDKIINNFKESKKKFVELYSDDLDYYASELCKSKSNSDFAYYFLCIRYIFGLFYEDEIMMSLEDAQSFGYSLLLQLAIMENKYAYNFFEMNGAFDDK